MTDRTSKQRTRKKRTIEAPKCLYCRSEDTFIYKTNRRMRYWKCHNCGDTGVISGPPADIAEAVDDIQER